MGRISVEQYKELIDKYLYYPGNPWICREALNTLCTYWKLTADYLDAIKMYIRGAKWDDTDEVRMIAISIAGEYLRKAFDKELLQLLLDVFENLGKINSITETSVSARALIQSCAYDAISRAMGKNHNEIPYFEDTEKLIEENQLDSLDLSIIKKAHLML